LDALLVKGVCYEEHVGVAGGGGEGCGERHRCAGMDR
jgi:hypothetical protein